MYHSLPSIHNKSAAESKTIKYYIHYFHIAYNKYSLCTPSPPKKTYLTIVFYFSCVSQLSQEKAKTMVMQNFGRYTRCNIRNVKKLNSWSLVTSKTVLSAVFLCLFFLCQQFVFPAFTILLNVPAVTIAYT